MGDIAMASSALEFSPLAYGAMCSSVLTSDVHLMENSFVSYAALVLVVCC